MTEEAQDIKTVKKEAHDNMESQIKVAMHSRIAHFKEQAEYTLINSHSLYIFMFCCSMKEYKFNYFII